VRARVAGGYFRSPNDTTKFNLLFLTDLRTAKGNNTARAIDTHTWGCEKRK